MLRSLRSPLVLACALLVACTTGARGLDASVDATVARDANADLSDAAISDAGTSSDASDASGAASLEDAWAPPFAGYTKVLHVGDSTVGYAAGISLEFKKMFPDAGLSYVSHTMTSAGLHTVAEDRIVEKMVKRHNPDLVIVQLGTNNLTVPHPEVYIPDIKSILAQVGHRGCYWIGPISLKFPERGMRGILRDNVAPCVFYDSYELTLERQSDGLHPSQRAAIFWSNEFFRFAARNPTTAL